MNTAKLKRWSIEDRLKTYSDADIVDYLSIALEDNDQKFFNQCLAKVAKIRKNQPYPKKPTA